MPAFALDTDCLIALEKTAWTTRRKCGLCRHATTRGEATVQIADRRRTAARWHLPAQLRVFRSRLEATGLGCLPVLKPPTASDLTYFNWCVITGDDDEEEGRRIHQTLFASPYDHEQAVPTGLQGDEERSRAEDKRQRASGTTVAWTTSARRHTSRPEPMCSSPPTMPPSRTAHATPCPLSVPGRSSRPPMPLATAAEPSAILSGPALPGLIAVHRASARW